MPKWESASCLIRYVEIENEEFEEKLEDVMIFLLEQKRQLPKVFSPPTSQSDLPIHALVNQPKYCARLNGARRLKGSFRERI